MPVERFGEVNTHVEVAEGVAGTSASDGTAVATDGTGLANDASGSYVAVLTGVTLSDAFALISLL